ncbi:MAG6450 family protein [Staphylococcus gallinarum]|uniref:MAG6450 family protein n=2 Tax=Staphylococcus gallinarum TaxID=1293 RepID=UPI000D1E041E|nr:hypothetical protein [Staphylococcus gallinarum]PTK88619.1 hypothetical protein BUZ13_12930 [Staphylococcus gallinarum]RIO87741.1 hypothetical protein BUZ06_09810 [Staphylococcus gallinarum]
MTKLTKLKSEHTAKGTKLTNLKSRVFKLAIGTELEPKYCFDTNKPKDLTKELHNFIKETVYKGLTITEVDNLFLRKKGPVKEMKNNIEILHYGKDRKQFRIHGFYDDKGYFNILRLDLNHKYHK